MIDKLRRRLPDAAQSENDLLSDLIADSGALICAYTRRAAVPEELLGAQVELAAIMYNRMGMEGETGHAEGGVSRQTEGLPEEIACQIRPWRLGKTVSP